jgi:serine/threonine protein kinase
MSLVGKILTASLGLVATSPSGRVKLEEKTYLIRDKVLGEGGFGTVEEAEDLSSKSPVAVKTVKEDPIANVEAQALRLFRGIPHAVGFRADILGSPKSKPEEQKRHIVMDLVKNKHIVATFFNPQTPDIRLTYDERITISRQVLEFLEAVHSRGWTFFDLKLSNLIFDRDSQSLKVIDFGGARDTTQKDFLPPITTASHRAPEYIFEKQLSPSYDMWSFGCVLFTLLTDRTLFHIPQDIKTENRSHYVLQQIVAQLGKPPFEYLITSPAAPKIFDADLEFREKTQMPPIKKWEEVLREKGQKEGWPAEEIELWIGMLGSCLRYENRATATELLKSPIFQNEIGVHLFFNSHRLAQCKMYILRSEFDDASESLPNDNCYDLKVDIHNSTDKHLHISKDLEGEYIIVLEKDGNSIRRKVLLKEGSILDISDLQQDLLAPKAFSSRRRNLLQQFDEDALEQEPEMPPIKEERPPDVLPMGLSTLSVHWLLNQNAAKPKLAALAEKTEEQTAKQPEIPPLEPRKSKQLMKRQQRATELAAAEAEPIIQSKRRRAPAQQENPQ